MAIWICNDCGFTKDTRCKPKKCETCSSGNFSKKEDDSSKEKTTVMKK